MTVKTFFGDCRQVLRGLPDKSVNCVVTSPPYFQQRSYLSKDDPAKAFEIGLEPTPRAYIEVLVSVFEECRRVLTDDGSIWVNIGDSYAMSGRGGNPATSVHQKQKSNAGSLVAPVKTAVLKEQFVTDANGKRVAVLLDLKTYAQMREAQEELADIQAYDAARPKIGAELARGDFTTLADYRASRGRNGK